MCMCVGLKFWSNYYNMRMMFKKKKSGFLKTGKYKLEANKNFKKKLNKNFYLNFLGFKDSDQFFKCITIDLY